MYIVTSRNRFDVRFYVTLILLSCVYYNSMDKRVVTNVLNLNHNYLKILPVVKVVHSKVSSVYVLMGETVVIKYFA